MRNRRGIECVELAVTLPLLILVVACTIQICNRIHISKMMYLATSDAIHAGGKAVGGEAMARKVFQDRCEALGITGAKLFLSAGFDTAAPRTRLAAHSVAPAKENQLPFPTYLILPSNISSGKVAYRKEK